MSSKATKIAAESAAVPSDLERLVATERRLTELVAAAREEGRRIVAEAQAGARARERRTQAELDAAAATLRRDIDAARDRAMVALREQAAREVARFVGVGDDPIRRLAEYVLERVVGSETVP